MEDIRVLVVCAVNGHGGPVQSIKAVTKRAAEARIQVLAATQPQEADAGTGPFSPGRVVPIHRPRGLGLPRAQAALIRRHRKIKEHIDVIHANGLTEAAVVLPLAFLTRIPVVVWVHNSHRPRAYGYVEPLISRLGRGWSFFAVSSLAASQVRVAKPIVIPNPIDRNVVAERRVNSRLMRVSFLAGSDRPHKGFDLLPNIIAHTKTSNLKWCIYASPPYSSPDKRTTDAWNELLSDRFPNVEIRERVLDVRAAFENADLVIAPSRQESFNRVIAESLANGVPVVASDIPPHRDLLASGAGLLYPVNDTIAAAALIDRVASDQDLYAAMSTEALASSSQYDAELVSRRMLAEWSRASGLDRRPLLGEEI